MSVTSGEYEPNDEECERGSEHEEEDEDKSNEDITAENLSVIKYI